MTTAATQTSVSGVHRHPIFGRLGGNELEIRREHADDDVRVAIENDGLVEDVIAAAVAVLPGRVREDHGTRRGGLILARLEVTTQNGRDAEGMEKTGAHEGAPGGHG